MTAQERATTYTLDDLRALEARPENADKRFELIAGEIYEVPTPNPLHNYIVAQLVFFLLGFVRPKQLGYVFGDVTSYTLPNGDELIPDASFISSERQSLPLPDKFYIAPDLAVEVVSPSNREREMIDKAESYLQSGARLVWVIYPIIRVVDVIRRNADGSLTIRKVESDGLLDGEDVLPGFTLSVQELFPAE